MGFMKGGWSKIDFDDNAGFSSPTTLAEGLILKEGTTLEFSTPTEMLANEKDVSTGKKVSFVIRSKELSAASITELVAAEEAQTELYFRFYGIDQSKYYTLKKVLVRVDHEPKPAGAFNARKISGSGFALTEADLMALTGA
jgi:hypothetical protein